MQSSSEFLDRLESLETFLHTHGTYWEKSPFHHEQPTWTTSEPKLAQYLLGLPEEKVLKLSASRHQLVECLIPWLPKLATIRELCLFPQHPTAALGPERFFAYVPGRKRAQVEAFASSTSAIDDINLGLHPWVEWCAGKGHLGRWLAHTSGQEVLSFEINPDLCAKGQALAARAGVRQTFVCQDVLHDEAIQLPPRHRIVALHACGQLHRSLLQYIAHAPVPAVDLAPCCYDHMSPSSYTGFNPETRLKLDRLALRLAATDRCRGRRNIHRQRRELSWKLAYTSARQMYTGIRPQAPLASSPRAWSKLSFPEWNQAMAARDGFRFAASTNWEALERLGLERRARFERLNLPRLAFRRAIETYLVLDMALFLARQGYQLSLRQFCNESLSPRNFLISARTRLS